MVQEVDAIIGRNIMKMRKLRGLTQKGLAKMLDITPQQVQKYEMGKNAVLPAKLSRMAEIFRCDIQDFFHDSDVIFKIDDKPITHACLEQYKLQQMIKDFLSLGDSPFMQQQIKNVVSSMVKTFKEYPALSEKVKV